MDQTNKTLIRGTLALIFAICIVSILSLQLNFQAYSPLLSIIFLLIWSLFNTWSLSKSVQKRVRFAIAITLLISLLLTLFTTWFSFVGFLLIYYGFIIFIITVIVLLIQRVFKRYKTSKWVLLSATLILSGTLAVLVGGIIAAPIPLFDNDDETTTLKHLYETDQEDRLSGYWIVNPNRDRQRLEYVLAVTEANTVLTPEDMYYAAYILQHGTCTDHFRIANELASEAAKNDIENADWLAKATFDRWQLALGNQQEYGTQQMPIPIKRPCN